MRRNENKTNPKAKLSIYKARVKDIEEQLLRVQYLIEKLNNNSPILLYERMYLLDNLYVKLHKLQTRRDSYNKTIGELICGLGQD